MLFFLWIVLGGFDLSWFFFILSGSGCDRSYWVCVLVFSICAVVGEGGAWCEC